MSTFATPDVGASRLEFDQAVEKLRWELAEFRREMQEGFAGLRSEMHRQHRRTIKWIAAFYVPMAAVSWATMIAVLLKGA